MRDDQAKEVKLVIPREGEPRDTLYGLYIDGIYVPVMEIHFGMTAHGENTISFTLWRNRVIVETI